MGEISFKPLIEDMTWSYSRVSSFDECPGAWFLTYIRGQPEISKFYSSFGSFVHRILERYYSGELGKDEMLMEFLTKFSDEVHGERPAQSIVDKYVDGVASYLCTFSPLPFEPIDVEKYLKFTVGDKDFVGIIDFIGKTDEGYCIVDNKSADLRPRSKRKYPTQKDMELDEKLRQLYLYSTALKQEYGEFPTLLCFNCYRTGTLIKEPFNIDAYNATIEWVLSEIEKIENEEYFVSVPDYFRCKWICGHSEHCEEYDEYLRERRRGIR